MNESLVKGFWTIESYRSAEVSRSAQEAFALALPYVQEFLCAQHPFRDGPVCPFVPSALRQRHIFFTECAAGDTSRDHALQVKRSIDFYLSTKGERKSFGAVIILFPHEYDYGRLGQLQFENKEQCVRELLMLGSLFPESNSPSLRNPDYFPLRMPTPCLVIRDMVPGDIAFLDPSGYDLKKRLLFLDAFIRKFDGCSGQVGKKVEEAKALYHAHVERLRLRRICLSAAAFITFAATLYALF